MQPTPRLRVLSDRNPRVLVFVYLCRGLSENMEERPTSWVYIEILTCRAIFYHLEEYRSHGNEREAERARGQGARPPHLGARPGTSANHRMEYTTQRSRRADRNAYIICYIWSSELRDINKRRTPHKRATGLIGPKSDFGPLRPMCILMRYGGKFSTTLPAEPKMHRGGGLYKQTPWTGRVYRCGSNILCGV